MNRPISSRPLQPDNSGCETNLRQPGQPLTFILESHCAHSSLMLPRTVLWGWKRDRGQLSRTIYLSGQIEQQEQQLVLREPYLYYHHRAETQHIVMLDEVLAGHDQPGLNKKMYLNSSSSLAELNFELGMAKHQDTYHVKRLRSRRPHIVPPVRLIDPVRDFTAKKFAPFDLYAGSGLSYEAGIPTLASVHEAFGVDDRQRDRFLFGVEDQLPAELAKDIRGTLHRMVEVDCACVHMAPSPCHEMITRLYEQGWIGRVFSDNIDNLLQQCGMNVVPTRGTGLFNEPVKVDFSRDARSLLVIGIAADRRSIIRQARQCGLRVVVINPVHPVSPQSKNLDYLREGDLFLMQTAAEALPDICEQLL